MYLSDHVSTKKPLLYWKEVLNEWVFLVHKIQRVAKGRASVYAERERANTGLLASAAIRNGWIALEECSSEKIGKVSDKDSYKGKSDLYLWRDEKHHEIEAKFIRYRMFSHGQLERVKQAHDNAKSDSRRSTYIGYKSERKIAVTFIVPIITPRKSNRYSDSDLSKELQRIIDYIKTELKPVFTSYAFPGPVDIWGSSQKSQALGVILIGDQIA